MGHLRTLGLSPAEAMLLSGKASIEAIPNFEELLVDENSDVESNARFDIDAKTQAKLYAVFATFSDLELFILMKEFGFFGKEMGSMTVREMSYQDYFVDMVRKEKLGLKNIEFGNVKVTVKHAFFIDVVRYVV